MPNVRLKDIEAKTTADLIDETVKSLKLQNNEQTKALLRQLNFVGNTNDFARAIILQFLRRIEINSVNGYKILLINILTLYPDLIIHPDKDLEDAIVTLKTEISGNLLSNVRNTKIKFKNSTDKEEFTEMPL